MEAVALVNAMRKPKGALQNSWNLYSGFWLPACFENRSVILPSHPFAGNVLLEICPKEIISAYKKVSFALLLITAQFTMDKM